MRIGIDARFYGPRQTGIGRYVERLLSHLQRIDTQNEYVVWLRDESFETWQTDNPRWKAVRAEARWYSLKEQQLMPGLFRQAKVDLVHIPHFNVPILYRGPWVVTIHDLILDEFPTERASTLGPLLFAAKFAVYKFVVSQAVTRAAHVITVSEHSRSDLLRRFPISPDKVSVTYESVDPLPPAGLVQVLRNRGIIRPFVLHVGNSYPHKNLERLLTAWSLLQRRHPGGQLVFVGHRDYFSTRLEEFARQKKIPNVLWYGFAPDDELASLYQQARVYAFPSLSEGFGLPGLEAMDVDLPVAAARSSCLPEIFQGAAEYFNPYDVDDMAGAIERTMYDDQVRQRLISAGQKRLDDFSWERMAQQTLTIYQQAYARQSAGTGQ